MEPLLTNLSDSEFIDLLRRRQIELRLGEGKLRISAPLGAMDEALIEELGRRRAMLLAYLKQKASAAGLTRAPLSYAQERLWLLERFHPGNYAYNIPAAFVIDAAVEISWIQRAIDTVVQRHDALRTSFREDEQGNAFQQVHANAAAPLKFMDLCEFSGLDAETKLVEQLRAWARKPYDLGAAPLVRFYLVRLKPDKHVVFINIHHIISDQWSMRILYRELLSTYRDVADGQAPALLPLPQQYADYARQERETSPERNGRVQQQMEYWQRQLAGAPDPPQLPFQRTPLAEKPFDGAIYNIQLTEEDTAAIRALARLHRASPYMVLLTAFTALLFRYTGKADFCVGSPVSQRTRTDTEAMIGLFVNTLVLRSPVVNDPSFNNLLTTVRETVLDAQANHEAPLQSILTALHPAGMMRPLFRTMFAFDTYTGSEEGEQIPLDPGFAKLDLTLQLYEQRSRIGGWFEYRTDLFSADDIARFGNAFVLLLRDAMAEPGKRVARLTILPEEERRRLLVERNATKMDFPRDQTIHGLFEEQVVKSPDTVALIDGDRHYSYHDLNSRANQVAERLLAHGVPVESIIGVRMERSVRMVAAMLGILKAGCAYLPLDPLYPEERLKFMIEDSGCCLVLDGAPLVYESPFHSRDEDPASVSSANLAYVIYTSGSTGKPKGVAIEHHSAVSFLHWARTTFKPEVLRGTLASISISFDLSVFEIFVPLVCGQMVILANDVLGLPALPAAAEVTLMTVVPSAASALLASGGIPATVRTIHLGGEASTPSLVDRLYAETAVVDVNDLYGPTETTIYSTWSRRVPGGRATIGRPLANTQVYIVDGSLELVPDGLPGELLIAGEGVARGYLHRPELTAERFVSLAHLGVEGRAYRTGDLCKYLDDGSIAYLGRLDNQVKVRGFRVEVAEVEAVLRAHSSVREAVVVARDAGDDGAALAAAVILRPAQQLDVPTLVTHQAKTLPSSMLVRSIVAVDDFPHTANGKVDRKRVQAMLAAQPADRTITEPQDKLERELVRIWKEGFGIQGVGIDDDFFQLGGHSLLALRLFSEIESRLGQRMMLSVLFQAPTIRQLAEYMRNQPSH